MLHIDIIVGLLVCYLLEIKLSYGLQRNELVYFLWSRGGPMTDCFSFLYNNIFTASLLFMNNVIAI